MGLLVPARTLPCKQSPAHRVFATQHEANLAAGIGGDGTVGIAHHREEGLAEMPHLLDEVEVQPLALTCGEGRESALPQERQPAHPASHCAHAHPGSRGCHLP